MGYRSNVAVMITAENKENFNRYLKELKESEDEALQSIIEDSDMADNGEDAIRLNWEDVKWYEDYEDVGAFEDWLESITGDEGTSYHFVRIGEDLDDIEERIEGDPNYWVYIERQLSTDF